MDRRKAKNVTRSRVPNKNVLWKKSNSKGETHKLGTATSFAQVVIETV